MVRLSRSGRDANPQYSLLCQVWGRICFAIDNILRKGIGGGFPLCKSAGTTQVLTIYALKSKGGSRQMKNVKAIRLEARESSYEDTSSEQSIAA